MTHQAVRNKKKGKDFERETVHFFEEKGWAAKRSWGSDGRSLGLTEDVDVVVGHKVGETFIIKYKIQCKRKQSLPKYLQPSTTVDFVVVKQNNKPTLVIVPLEIAEEWLRKIEAK